MTSLEIGNTGVSCTQISTAVISALRDLLLYQAPPASGVFHVWSQCRPERQCSPQSMSAVVRASSAIPGLRLGIVLHDAACSGYCRPMIATRSLYRSRFVHHRWPMTRGCCPVQWGQWTLIAEAAACAAVAKLTPRCVHALQYPANQSLRTPKSSPS
jgi:hypothetical protein